jgi:hypothetical protein
MGISCKNAASAASGFSHLLADTLYAENGAGEEDGRTLIFPPGTPLVKGSNSAALSVSHELQKDEQQRRRHVE